MFLNIFYIFLTCFPFLYSNVSVKYAFSNQKAKKLLLFCGNMI